MSQLAPTTKKMQWMILRGPIVKTLLVLGWPLMLTNLLQMSYELVNTFWLGRYVGATGIAATTLAWPLVFFMVSFSSGMTVAGTSLVSQYTGMKDKDGVKKSAGQVFSLMIIFSIILSIIGYLISIPLINYMSAGQEVGTQSIQYIRIIFLSMPFMFIATTFAAVFRGFGDTMTPLIISIVSLGINFVLDPLLIGGLGPVDSMGITGAALATLIARAVASIVCIYLLFYGGRSLKLKLEHLKLTREKVKTIFEIGIPASLGQAFVSLGFVMMMSYVAYYGEDMLATYGIGTRLVNLVFILTGGLTGAAATMIGQNLGAGQMDRTDRIFKKTLAVSALFLLACSILFYIFCEQFFGIFVRDSVIIEEGQRFMLIFGFSIIGFGIFSSVQSAYQASGRTLPNMVMGMIRLWGLRVPLAYIFAFTLGWGVPGIWVGMGLSNFVSAGIALAWASTGSWKRPVAKKKPVDLADRI